MEGSVSVLDKGIFEVQGDDTLKRLYVDHLRVNLRAKIERIGTLDEIPQGGSFLFEKERTLFWWVGDLKEEIFLDENFFLLVDGKVSKKIECIQRQNFPKPKPWEVEKAAMKFVSDFAVRDKLSVNPKKIVTLYGTNLGVLYFELRKRQWLGSEGKTGRPTPDFFQVLRSLEKKHKKLFFYWLEKFSQDKSVVVSLSAFLSSFVVDWYTYAIAGSNPKKKWFTENVLAPTVSKWGRSRVVELFEFLCEAESFGKRSSVNPWLWYVSRWELFWSS